MGGVANHRLEAFTRGTDVLPGLHARVHDGWWLLARQWQLGELDGADAGTPITATLVLRSSPVAAWQASGGRAEPYRGSVPLEALAESDGLRLPWRDRVAAGLRLARSLHRVGVDPGALIALHPLGVPDAAVDPAIDPASHATSAVTPAEVAAVGAVTSGRVADPDAVAAAFDSGVDALVAGAGSEAARPVLAAWRGWWAQRQPLATGAWQGSELSYSLRVAVRDPAAPVYRADRFDGGALDWYAFDAAPTAGDPTAAAAVPAAQPASGGLAAPPSVVAEPVTTVTIPSPLTFHGAPVGRYWQLEDARTDFGGVETFPTEVGKLLLAEFTACYGGDWYRLPVTVPCGSAVHIDALVSTDTFGIATLVRAASSVAGARPWRMFEHSSASGTEPATVDGSWLLIPSALGPVLESEPLEEVAVMRDPAADLVWAVEHIVTNAVGRPVRRSEDLRAQGREPALDPRAPLPDSWVWRLQTNVPDNWIPLLPARGLAAGGDDQLVQGAMMRYRRAPDGTLSSVPVLPAGLLLRDGIVLPERVVPREGLSVKRTRRSAREVSGRRVTWWSRRASVGHGEGSSGLAYDGLHVDGSPRALGQ